MTATIEFEAQIDRLQHHWHLKLGPSTLTPVDVPYKHRHGHVRRLGRRLMGDKGLVKETDKSLP